MLANKMNDSLLNVISRMPAFRGPLQSRVGALPSAMASAMARQHPEEVSQLVERFKALSARAVQGGNQSVMTRCVAVGQRINEVLAGNSALALKALSAEVESLTVD